MKVLFITPRFYPQLGGVEKHVKSVGEKLSNNGHEITVITCTDRTDLKAFEKMDGMSVYRKFIKAPPIRSRASSISSLSKMMIFLLKNFALIKNHNIIHLHDPEAFLWFAPIILFCRKPVFITFHGFEKYPVPMPSKIIRKIAEKCTSGNICVGDFITKWYGTQANFVIVGGVETNGNLPNGVIDEGAIFVGRLERDTGILNFIETLIILKNNFGINLPLHICGDGPLRQQIMQSAKEHDLQIFLHGFVDDVRAQIVKHRYAFVTGYLSILDAMYCKRLVFSIYDNPLKRDYLYSIPENEKLMFIAGSPKDLATKLHDVIRANESAKNILENAFAFAKSQSWENVARVYQTLYGDEKN